MRIVRLAVMLVAAAGAWGQDQELTVHLVKGELVPLTVLLQAERTATWLYAGIGLKLKWSSDGKDGLSMQFDAGLPEWFHPGALGYAMPYAQTGTRIHVLVDRLQFRCRSRSVERCWGMCWRTSWRMSCKDSHTTRKRAS